MQKLRLAAACLGLLTIAACSPATEAPDTQVTGIATESLRGATLQSADGEIRVTRVGDAGNQGVMITQAPVAVTFTVEGEGARIRVRQEGQWFDVPAEGTNTIMLGRGGAGQIRVFSRDTPEVVVRVTNVADCSTTTCTPVPVPPAETEQTEEDAQP
ncbi:MAG: hypothetical protein AB7O98_11985 [Hyphomonadaceae bacterium]